MDKTNQLYSGDSSAETEKLPNEGLPTGETISPSLISCPDSGVTDEFCQATDRLNVVDIQKNNVKSVIGIDQDDYYPRWDSLAGPPLDGLLFHLFNNEDLKDLNKFAMVSPYYRNEAKRFTKRAENRPGIKELYLRPHYKLPDGFLVSIDLFPSNIPFHDFSGLGGFRKVVGREKSPALADVFLNGIEDPTIGQVANLLSTTIHKVEISRASLNCFTVAAQLLRNVTIMYLSFWSTVIDDNTAPIIIDIVSHLKSNCNKLHVSMKNKRGLSDSESFVITLLSDVTSLEFWDERTTPFFGLPNSFWEKYLNAKLSSGSVGWIKMGMHGEKITKAPFNINPNLRFRCLEWGKA